MEDKIYVLIVYYYDDNNEFCYSISPDMHNLNIQLQYAYYRYRLANGKYNGLGSQKINPTLTICTKDYIFYRREYDGAEWFEYVLTKQYILDNADAFNDKNIIRADTYYGINNHCWNEGYDYDL